LYFDVVVALLQTFNPPKGETIKNRLEVRGIPRGQFL